MVDQRQKRGVTRESAVERAMRDQEVLRANRDLAAYFKGRRTEREARAALKIVKAFVRDRERRDVKSRPPLSEAIVAGAAKKPSKKAPSRKAASKPVERKRRKVRRKPPVDMTINAEIAERIDE